MGGSRLSLACLIWGVRRWMEARECHCGAPGDGAQLQERERLLRSAEAVRGVFA
jgi:hypothetical protein